jgi:hypothetical protein
MLCAPCITLASLTEKYLEPVPPATATTSREINGELVPCCDECARCHDELVSTGNTAP